MNKEILSTTLLSHPAPIPMHLEMPELEKAIKDGKIFTQSQKAKEPPF